MNFGRGFKRAWYALLGLIWVIVIAATASGGPAKVGESIVYMLLFTLVWLALGGVLLWIGRGFRKDEA